MAGAPLALVAFGSGCQGEPERLCDRPRVLWPYFELDPRADISDEPGLQVTIDLRTSLSPGTEVDLFLQVGEDAPLLLQTRPTAEGGALRFEAVTLPLGPLTLFIEAENECGPLSSGRSTFVWDGLGFPRCDLFIPGAPAAEIGDPPPILPAEADADGEREGFQVAVEVAAGRPDMDVSLFVLDRDSGAEEVYLEPSGNDLRADFLLDLGAGEWAIRALCRWEPEDLRESSATLAFRIEPGRN